MQVIVAPAVPYSLTRYSLIGLVLVALFILGFGAWAYFTPINSAVVAQGTVKVLSQRKQIQHLEGGIVDSILVHEGQRVSSGQTLVLLDETFARAEHTRLNMQRHELGVREAVLKAERSLKHDVEFPLYDTTGLDVQWLDDQKQAAASLFAISRGNLESQMAIADKKIEQLNEQANGLRIQKVAKVEQLSFIEDEIDSWKEMVEKKLSNKLRFLEVQSEAAELRGVIAQLDARAAEVQVMLGETQLEKLSLEQSYRERAAKELRDVQFSLKDISKRLESAENILERITIKSPVDGIVVGLNVHTVGAVIKPGDTLMELVSEKDSLIIEARVSPTDVDQVFDKMAARARIASYKRHEMPELDGLVESISADVLEDELNRSHYYLARISISGFIEEAGSDPTQSADLGMIQPGMPAEVMIQTGVSTPLQYLAEPILNAFNRAWRDK